MEQTWDHLHRVSSGQQWSGAGGCSAQWAHGKRREEVGGRGGGVLTHQDWWALLWARDAVDPQLLFCHHDYISA